MKHLVRVGGLLVAILIVVFIVPRVAPIPAFLVDFGFHPRSINENIAAWSNLPFEYAQSSVCLNCHQDEYNLWQIGNHKVVSCENCHGPAGAHLATGARPVVNTSRELCGTCHEKVVGRPSTFPQVDLTEMGEQKSCVTCHDPHDPRAGMPAQVPHTLEERTDCQSCHASHEPFEKIPPQLPHTLEGRSECLSCHGPTEFRGATLPHIPGGMEASTNCLLCHQVGGGIKPLPEDHAGRKSATCLNCHRSE